MADTVYTYLSRKELLNLLGKGYRSVLASLKKSKLIESYKDVIEIGMSKDQSIHFQSVLEFHSVRGLPSSPITKKANGDN